MGAIFHNGDYVGSVPPIDDSSVSDKTLWSSQKTKEEIDALDATKTNQSVIAATVSGTVSSRAYSIGHRFMKDGYLCVCIKPIASGEAFVLNSNYVIGYIEGGGLPEIPNGADLNNYFVTGEYNVGTAAIANSLLHKPAELSASFRLRVLCGNYVEGNGVIDAPATQIIEHMNSNNGGFFYIRRKAYQGSWGSWYKFTGTAVS